MGAHLEAIRIQFRTSLPLASTVDRSTREPQVRLGDGLIGTIVANDQGTDIDITGIYDLEPGWVDLLDGIASGRLDAPTSPFGIYDRYPPGLRDFCDAIYLRSGEVAEEFIKIIRWRLNPGDWLGERISSSGSSLWWSRNGHSWSMMGQKPWIIGQVAPTGLRLDDSSADALSSITESGEREPLGREIWNSAVSATARQDHRTAIILAVSAVEIELKRFIARVVPHAEWLLENLPAPPIAQVINKYLPELPGVASDRLPPKKLVKILEEAVKTRNTLIHVGYKAPATRDDLPTATQAEDILDVTSDMLWLIDGYTGHAWAFDHLSDESKQLLGLKMG